AAGASASRFAADIESVPAAVDEIDVGVAPVEKERPVARRDAAKGMAGGIADHIGLGLDDTTARRSFGVLANQGLADQESCEGGGVYGKLAAAKAARSPIHASS